MKGVSMKPKTVMIIAVTIVAALVIGIPVPKKQPYVSLSIKTGKDTYYVGDEVEIRYCVVNKMPFSVRLEPIRYLETTFYPADDASKIVRQVSNVTSGNEIYLTPFQMYDRDEMVKFTISREASYILYMKLESMETTKTLNVKPRGS